MKIEFAEFVTVLNHDMILFTFDLIDFSGPSNAFDRDKDHAVFLS